jgi:gamma-glutamylcyclotransferase (GGCT)/AIG2-like uncharacterized protein YtfP
MRNFLIRRAEQAPFCAMFLRRSSHLPRGNMSAAAASEPLFSYGTLQNQAVQLATFGRRLMGTPDALPRYRQVRREVGDARVAAISGSKYYLNLEFTGRESDSVVGVLFQVTREELDQADRYEASANYERIRVCLKSGREAWVYVGAGSGKR